jgi:hypothetical protein
VTVSPVLTSPCSRLPVGGIGALAAMGDVSEGFKSGINPPWARANWLKLSSLTLGLAVVKITLPTCSALE